MGLATLTTMGVTGNTIAEKSVRTAQKIKNGASVKDIAGETKDKFVNNAKLAGKIVGISTVTGTVGALASLEALTGCVSAKLPDFAKNLIQKASNSNLAKNIGKAGARGFVVGGSMFKAHPLLFTASTIIGSVGSILIGKAVVDNAKTEGKIEQKYDDKLALKNNAAAALDIDI